MKRRGDSRARPGHGRGERSQDLDNNLDPIEIVSLSNLRDAKAEPVRESPIDRFFCFLGSLLWLDVSVDQTMSWTKKLYVFVCVTCLSVLAGVAWRQSPSDLLTTLTFRQSLPEDEKEDISSNSHRLFEGGEGAGEGGHTASQHVLRPKSWRRAPARLDMTQRNCLPRASLKEAARAQMRYQKMAKRSWPGNGAVVYTCVVVQGRTASGVSGCSGLGDRVNGLLTAYWLAVFTCRAFFIDWRRPSALEQYWTPNQLNWTIPYMENRASASYVRKHFSHNVDKNCSGLLQLATSASVVRFSATHGRSAPCLRQYLSAYKIKGRFPWREWVESLSRLFKPSDYLLAEFSQFKKKTNWSPEKGVCIQVRSGGSIGLVYPNNRQQIEPTRAYRENPSLPFRCAAKFYERKSDLGMAGKAVTSQHYVVFSDHDATLNDARKFLPHGARISSTESLGPIIHIDKNAPMSESNPKQRKRKKFNEEVRLGEKRVFLDHFFLSKCKNVVSSDSRFFYSALVFSSDREQKQVIVPRYSAQKCIIGDVFMKGIQAHF